jgi:anti-sigma regulatory factor (Ser/Thr protein kinase)
MIAGWPLQDSLELGALPGAVPCARLHTRHVLWEWGLTELGENVELLVSELFTNSVQATRSRGSIGPVRLWLLSDRARVLVLVWDISPLPPVRIPETADVEGGRGLMLVEALGERWDWYVPQHMGGKVVWVLVSGRPRMTVVRRPG